MTNNLSSTKFRIQYFYLAIQRRESAEDPNDEQQSYRGLFHVRWQNKLNLSA